MCWADESRSASVRILACARSNLLRRRCLPTEEKGRGEASEPADDGRRFGYGLGIDHLGGLKTRGRWRCWN